MEADVTVSSPKSFICKYPPLIGLPTYNHGSAHECEFMERNEGIDTPEGLLVRIHRATVWDKGKSHWPNPSVN